MMNKFQKGRSINACLKKVSSDLANFETLLEGVRAFFTKNKNLNEQPLPSVHSVKARIKSEKSLREKILRKWNENGPIETKNIFKKITDIAGVRVLHLHSGQFPTIHKEIQKMIANKMWYYVEKPKAYSWDPEAIQRMKKYGIKTELRPNLYSSVHYLVTTNPNSPYKCEIQVRTLFDEIWGEIDHSINYPEKIPSASTKRQLFVLAKLAATGTTLADSIFSSYAEYMAQHS